MTRPDLQVVPAFYQGYVNHVKDLDMMDAIRQSGELTIPLIQSIPEEMGSYRYAEGKWSIKELLCHMMDAERIFCYRALRFSRNDKTPLSGFEENDYAPEANAHARTVIQLADEMHRLRAATLDLFSSFTPAMLARTGTANNTEVSVLTIGYIVAGHESHHRNMLLERYLKS
jgi:uncharacterized damage-inducible protein DinB